VAKGPDLGFWVAFFGGMAGFLLLTKVSSALYGDDKTGSPFVYDSLTKGIEWRYKSATRLDEYMEEIKPKIMQLQVDLEAAGALSDEKAVAALTDEYHRLRSRVARESNSILFGASAPPREQYLADYGCARWSPEALKVIAGHGPLVEMGAGSGHWQKALSGAGTDVLSFDSMEDLPLPGLAPVGTVHKGGFEVLGRYPRRTLFLCCPPPGPMAFECIRQYAGDHFVFVGEGRGGSNGNASFFDVLETQWEVVAQCELLPFPQCHEKLFVLKRR
jgi:hypothetical protein